MGVFFEEKKFMVELHNDDFLKIRKIKKASVDLIITSPPYNVDIKYNSHRDTLTHEQYLQFSKAWLKKAYTLMKDDGRMCLNIPLDKNKGGQQSVYSDILQIAKDLGWKYHSTVIWHEGNISRRTAWGSWKSARAPYVIAPVEVIVILFKHSWKKLKQGLSTIKRSEFIEWTNGVWTFSGESKKRVGHPAPFPLELPRRCLHLFSYKGDIVLDPFLGSGTTAVACINEDRGVIGVEIDTEYCKLAKERIKESIKSKQQTRLI